MTQEQLVQLLKKNGYDHGWVLNGTILTVWEHEENPPAPLIKPKVVD
jgi:hypothetical protein